MVAIGRDSTGLLVKPDVAQAQMNAEVPPPVQAPAPAGGQAPPAIPVGKTAGFPSPAPAAPKPPTRFYGSVKLDALRMVRDAGTLSKEVVEHLTSQLGAEVEITLEIQAQVASGIPEKTVRDVSENCRTLKFKTAEFEAD